MNSENIYELDYSEKVAMFGQFWGPNIFCYDFLSATGDDYHLFLEILMVYVYSAVCRLGYGQYWECMDLAVLNS